VAAIAAVVTVAAAAASGGGTITTVAGTGSFGDGGFSGDGGSAMKAKLDSPLGLAFDGQGNLYIADYRNDRVRKVNQAGTITTFAGGGPGVLDSGDGGPATSATLSDPHDVAVDSRGDVYIAGEFGVVRKVSPNGTITTFAGRPPAAPCPCPEGDGGPATAARLFFPSGVATDAQGNVYIADADDHRVRKVDPSGTITTVAGIGEAGFSGDGGPAISAKLSLPAGIALDGHGDLFIADGYRVRKVNSTGRITTIAGTGQPGFSGDGGRATLAKLYDPTGLAVDRAGNVYIADRYRVRKVSPDGTITTFAGTDAGFSGDGGPATSAELSYPSGVVLDEHGNVYISDTGNSRIRKVTLSSHALVLTLGGVSSQRPLAQRGITVTARCSDACSVVATGSVRITGTRYVFALTRARATFAKARSTQLKLDFPAAAEKRFSLLLKPGQRATALVTVRATDASGGSTTKTRKVAVRR
jgi:sugar lactone lactonase YvrE